MSNRSNNHLYFTVFLSVFAGRASFLAFKNTIKITKIEITALKTDFRNAFGGVNKHPGNVSHADINDIIAECTAGMELKKTTESTFAHMSKRGQLFQFKLIHIIFVDIVFNFKNTPTIVFDSHFCITGSSQRANAFALG